MKSLVRPELPTASACSSQATSAAVDNSAPVQTRPFSLIYRGLAVQTNRATSDSRTPSNPITIKISINVNPRVWPQRLGLP
jgi:hypothetical protein